MYVKFNPILLLLALLITSCEYSNKPAKGSEDEIIVVADSSEYEVLKPLLQETFEKTIYTPQPEKLFTLKRISLNEIESYQNHKNIILIGTINSQNNTSKFIKALLDTASARGINLDENHFFMKYDLWAKNQLVVMVTAKEISKIQTELQKQSDNLLYSFHQLSDKRLFEKLYNDKDEQKDIEGKLLKNYGWIIYVHQDYKLAREDKENAFVKLSCKQGDDMHKWIFVHWIENASPDYLTEDSIRAIRNRITWLFYRPKDDKSFITVSRDNYMSSEIDFKGRYGIVTQGVWNLDSKGMEGPFINYTIYDEKSKRIFMLDGSVFAPKYFKRNILQQLDVILQSFMTQDELNDQRKEDLLQSAQND